MIHIFFSINSKTYSEHLELIQLLINPDYLSLTKINALALRKTLSYNKKMKLKALMWSNTIDAHIARHDVTRDEASEVVFGQGRFALRGRDGVLQVFGQTAVGRYLKVIIRDHGDGTGFGITAMDMSDSDRKMYQRRRKG